MNRPNKALHWTGITLRSIPASPVGWAVLCLTAAAQASRESSRVIQLLLSVA